MGYPSNTTDSSNAGGVSAGLPRIIHIIWFGPHLPFQYELNVVRWADANHHFNIRLYVNDIKLALLARQKFLRHPNISVVHYNAIYNDSEPSLELGSNKVFLDAELTVQGGNMGAAADIFRLDALSRYGGFYVDMDILPKALDLEAVPISERNLFRCRLTVGEKGNRVFCMNDILIAKSKNVSIQMLRKILHKQYMSELNKHIQQDPLPGFADRAISKFFYGRGSQKVTILESAISQSEMPILMKSFFEHRDPWESIRRTSGPGVIDSYIKGTLKAVVGLGISQVLDELRCPETFLDASKQDHSWTEGGRKKLLKREENLKLQATRIQNWFRVQRGRRRAFCEHQFLMILWPDRKLHKILLEKADKEGYGYRRILEYIVANTKEIKQRWESSEKGLGDIAIAQENLRQLLVRIDIDPSLHKILSLPISDEDARIIATTFSPIQSSVDCPR